MFRKFVLILLTCLSSCVASRASEGDPGSCATDSDCPSETVEDADAGCVTQSRICGPLARCAAVGEPLPCDAECTRASDCPEGARPCDAPGSCGCGTFKTCRRGRCEMFADDSCVADGGPAIPPDPTFSPCGKASDCVGVGKSVHWCTGESGSSSWSCLDGQCVWDCPGARACRHAEPPSLCVECEDGTASCPPDSCEAGEPSEWTLEAVACGVPTFPELVPGSTLVAQREVNCVSVVSLAGVALGRVWPVGSTGFAGEIPFLGGRCAGTWLPTDAPRIVWACPACQFSTIGVP